MQKKKIYKYALDRLSFKQNKKYKLIVGNFGIKSITVGLINFNHLEVLRRKFSKQFKKLNKINKTKIIIRVSNWKPFTKKPMLSRMGKGAGSIILWKAFIKAGFILFEIATTVLFYNVLSIFKKASRFFPLKLVLIQL